MKIINNLVVTEPRGIVPSSILLSGRTESSLTIQWNAASDTGSDGYTVSLAEVSGSSINIQTTSSRFDSLTAGTQYTFEIMTYVGVGGSNRVSSDKATKSFITSNL